MIRRSRLAQFRTPASDDSSLGLVGFSHMSAHVHEHTASSRQAHIPALMSCGRDMGTAMVNLVSRKIEGMAHEHGFAVSDG